MMNSSTCKKDNLKLNLKQKKYLRCNELRTRTNEKNRTYVTAINGSLLATATTTAAAATTTTTTTTKWNNLNIMSPKDTDSHIILGNPNQLINSQAVVVVTTINAAAAAVAAVTTTPTTQDITTLPTIECMSTKQTETETATMPKASNTTNNLIGKIINDVSKHESNKPIVQSTAVVAAATAAIETTTTTNAILSKVINVHNCADENILRAVHDFPTSTLAAIDDSNTNLLLLQALERMRRTEAPPSILTAKIEADTTLLLSSWTHVNKLTPTTGKVTTNTTTTTMTTATILAAPTTKTKTTTTTSTATALTSTLYCHEQSVPARTLPTLTTAKSKSTENKCSSEVLTRVSNQKELEEYSTRLHCNNESLAAESTAIKHFTQALRSPIYRCEPLEYTEIPQGLTTTTKVSSLATTTITTNNILSNNLTSLAYKKAKLKSEFFDIPQSVDSQDLTRQQQLVKNNKTCQKLASPSLTQRRNIHNLQLKINKVADDQQQHTELGVGLDKLTTVLPCIAVNLTDTAVPKELSLVAQRKLDLANKFEQQISVKSSAAKATFSHTSKQFPRVEQLLQKFGSKGSIKMIVNPNKLNESNDNNLLSLKPDTFEQRHSPLSDEGCNLGQSPYSSDNEDNESIRTTSTTIERTKRKDKVARSASSDSALGLDVDDPMDAMAPAVPPTTEHNQKRRMTLTVTDLPLRPALLPLAEPTMLPDSPTAELQHSLQNLLDKTTVPSKVLLEERVVEIPEDPRSLGCSLSSSRRESAQSCASDYPPNEFGSVRFVRTPSVVVSDYSDDVMCGITLEEIEYFRAHRMRRRRSSLETAGTEKEGDATSDVSASSSCSNLYYCGSTISALDGTECYVNGTRMSLERKTSDCSTCSASGGEDDGFTIPEQPEEDSMHKEKDLSDLLAAQHLGPKRPKKVGLSPFAGVQY